MKGILLQNIGRDILDLVARRFTIDRNVARAILAVALYATSKDIKESALPCTEGGKSAFGYSGSVYEHMLIYIIDVRGAGTTALTNRCDL